MAHEPPAPDLGAVKRLHDAANDPTYSSPRVRRADIQAVVRLVDAQAAQLAAVEQAGRQWRAAAARTRPYEDELVPWKQEGWQAAMDALDAAEAALEATLAALDAPSEESP